MSSLPPCAFLDGLVHMGFDYFCGVPCSYFGPLLVELQQRDLPYQVASIEADAVGMAAGAALGGAKPLVMLQNSGLGNTVNAISSLVAPFHIPMVLLVSHRGLDKADKEAPQHDMMGHITYDQLKLLSIPAWSMPFQLDDALAVFAQALAQAENSQHPTAIVLEGKPFLADRKESPQHADRPTRLEAMQAISQGLTSETLVIASTGMVSRDLQTIEDRQANFYMVGSMGLTSSIGLGLASTTDKRVIVIDGDGSCLMRLGSLPTLGRYAPKNLLHIILDNASHSSTGGQATASPNVNFPSLALACGYPCARRAQTLDELTSAVRTFEVGQGPQLVYFSIQSGNAPNPARVERSLVQVKEDFMQAIHV